MACYRLYEWATTDDPLLRAVPRAVVLTMRGSARIDAPAFRACRRLCAQTWVQENAGWRRCAKPPRVVDSATDLLHAYWHACKAFANDPAPILILEDDALVMNADRAHYEAVDAFVRAAHYDVYGLGNGGMFDAFALGPHRRVRGVLLKKGSGISMFGRTNWQFRTFTLNPETGVFRYYAEKSTKPRGALQLVPCSTFSEEMPKGRTFRGKSRRASAGPWSIV